MMRSDELSFPDIAVAIRRGALRGVLDVMEWKAERWCKKGKGSNRKTKVLVSRVFHLVGKVDAKVVDRGLRDSKRK